MSDVFSVEVSVVHSWPDETRSDSKYELASREEVAKVAGRKVEDAILKAVPLNKVCSLVLGVKMIKEGVDVEKQQDALQDRIATLEQELKLLTKVCQDNDKEYQKERAVLEQQVADLTAENERLRTQRDVSRAASIEWEKDRDDLQAKLDKKDEALNTLQENYNTQGIALAETTIRLETTEAEQVEYNFQKMAEIESLKAKLEEAEKALKKERGEARLCRQRGNDLLKDNIRLADVIDRQTSEKRQVEAKLEEVRDKLDRKSWTLDIETQRADVAQAKLEEADRDYRARTNEWLESERKLIVAEEDRDEILKASNWAMDELAENNKKLQALRGAAEPIARCGRGFDEKKPDDLIRFLVNLISLIDNLKQTLEETA